MALRPLQKRFVEEYVIDLNASAAYQRAGYRATGHAAETNAARLLSNAEVASAIAALQQARSEATGITAERIIRELDCLANSDVGDILDFSGDQPKLLPANRIPERARRAIASVKVKRHFEGTGDDAREVEVIEFKLWDKGAAIAKAMQHLGMLVEKHEHTGTINHNVHNDASDAEIEDRIAELEKRAGGVSRPVGGEGSPPGP